VSAKYFKIGHFSVVAQYRESVGEKSADYRRKEFFKINTEERKI